MTAKEKAEQLVNNMYYSDIETMSKHCAKQCALLTVYQIIKSIPCIPSSIPCEDINDCIIQAREFWQEVKKEIEKL